MRILWVAVADARGHLMRAHLARRLLAEDGLAVDIATTAEEGVQFLRALGTPAMRFGRGYSLAFDARQNLDQRETERRLLRYLLDPMFGDLRQLDRLADRYALVVNDSFHPALLLAPVFQTRARIVSVYGEQMLEALAGYPLPLVRRVSAMAYARIEHTLSRSAISHPSARYYRLPPLIDAPSASIEEVRAQLGVRSKLAVVYLNPHFRDPALAGAIERALAGMTMYAVGEGFAERPGWRASDPHLADKVRAADLVISAPGMGTLAQVRAFGTPMIALSTDQPEQKRNLAHLDPDRSAVVDARRPDFTDAARLAGLGRIDSAPLGRPAWKDTFRRILNGIYSNERIIGHRDHQPARWWRHGRAASHELGAALAASLEADVSAVRALRSRRHLPRRQPSG